MHDRIRLLVSQQSFCVLCTQGESQPYGSLIAFAFTEDLKQFFFTMPMATRKYKLLSECPQVALVIVSRCQHPNDISQIEAVTITGKASRLPSGADFDQGIAWLKNRHPYLTSFLESAAMALYGIGILLLQSYMLIWAFCSITVWRSRSAFFWSPFSSRWAGRFLRCGESESWSQPVCFGRSL